MGRAGLQSLTSTAVTIGSSSTTVVAADADREFVVLTNDSDEDIYIDLTGGTAALNSGVRLNAQGGGISLSHPQVPYGAITAICASGSKTLCVTHGS